MALSIYTHEEDTPNIKNSDKYGSCAFSIGFSTNSFKGAVEKMPLIQGERIMTINGVADETIEIGYSTEWGESPTAKVASKLKEFTRADAFKMFSSRAFNPNPVSNKWTQIYPKDGAYISVGIKFRAYFKAGYLNTNSYMTIIPWLTYVTSPMTEFSFQQEISNIKDAITNAQAEGEKLGKELEGIRQENGQFTQKAVQALSSMYQAIENLSTDSRGSAVFTLEFGDIISKNDAIDWIIKDWDFKPSMVMGPENSPLWVDFNINMETNQKLSYDRLSKIFKFVQLAKI